MLILALLLIITGCHQEETPTVSHATNPEQVPTMVSHDITTVISDSGHTRYRITTKLWKMFEESKNPHWVFPEGVKAEELDNDFKVVTTLVCDSAYYDKLKQLWHLVGMVNITGANGRVIQTDEMNWDQGTHKLYSDAFIHVESEGKVIEGHGYESNEKLTTYTLRQVEAIFPMSDTQLPLH